MIENEKEEYYKLNRELMYICEFPDYDEELNRSIYNNVKNMYEKYVMGKINLKEWIEEDIIDGIKRKSDNSLFRQPMILLIYYLLSERRKELLKTWEYTADMLEPIADDLGVAIEPV